jgi:thiosulfate/3-mercaptopyruvate sulfurtransferase
MRGLVVMLALCVAQAAAASDFAYARIVDAGGTVVDTRPVAECQRASLPGARCLPPDELLGARGELPSERDILWLLGTAGLDGSETAWVVGDDATARDFVAGLLYLAGQKVVRIVGAPVVGQPATPGRARGIVRSAVWTAPMRDHLWVLGADLLREKPALIGPGVATANGRNAVVVAADAYRAVARFAQLRAGEGLAVRVHPAASAVAQMRAP